MGNLISDVGFPKGVFNIVTGFGEEVGLHICENKLINHSYILLGLVETGRKVYKNSTNTFKTVVLELGKNPMIIFEDADIDRAVNYAIKGAYSNFRSGLLFIIKDNYS